MEQGRVNGLLGGKDNRNERWKPFDDFAPDSLDFMTSDLSNNFGWMDMKSRDRKSVV